MPSITLWLKSVGPVPMMWYESTISASGALVVGGTTLKSTEQASPSKDGDGLFMQQLAQNLWKLLKPSFDMGRTAGTIIFDSLICASYVAASAKVDDTDLLCYVCATRNVSLHKQYNTAAFDAAIKQNPNAGGLTSPVMQGGVPQGVLAEIYLDQFASDGTSNITSTALAIYHEWMHNKTSFPVENVDWVHTAAGGNGVADFDGPANFRFPNARNIAIMADRLARIRNPQFLGGIK